VLRWADGIRRLQVWANGDYPRDAELALRFGAQGIGLCRTEHMFMEQVRLPHVQAMILSATTEERKRHLDELLPFQRSDFYGILKAMAGLPVVIRLIDPPSTSSCPPSRICWSRSPRPRPGATRGELRGQAEDARRGARPPRAEPMLGLRGCRLGLLYPEIIEMQVRAIMEAAVQLTKEGVKVYPRS